MISQQVLGRNVDIWKLMRSLYCRHCASWVIGSTASRSKPLVRLCCSWEHTRTNWREGKPPCRRASASSKNMLQICTCVKKRATCKILHLHPSPNSSLLWTASPANQLLGQIRSKPVIPLFGSYAKLLSAWWLMTTAKLKVLMMVVVFVKCFHTFAHSTRAGLDGIETRYLDFKMPVCCLELLEELNMTYGRVCSLVNVRNATKHLDLNYNDNTIRHLLTVFSKLGALSWFPDIDDTLVVLKPQWLMDSMSCLIREHGGKKYNNHQQLLNTLLKDDAARPLFRKEDVCSGRVSMALLSYVWQSNKPQYRALNAKPTEIQSLKKILKAFGLVCPVRMCTGTGEKEEEFFVVPALLEAPAKESFPETHIHGIVKQPDAKVCMCCWDFSEIQFLPRFLFERVACIVIVKHGVDPEAVRMARGVADIRIGKASLLLRLDEKQHCISAQIAHPSSPRGAQRILETVLIVVKHVLSAFPVAIPHMVMLQIPPKQRESAASTFNKIRNALRSHPNDDDGTMNMSTTPVIQEQPGEDEEPAPEPPTAARMALLKTPQIPPPSLAVITGECGKQKYNNLKLKYAGGFGQVYQGWSMDTEVPRPYAFKRLVVVNKTLKDLDPAKFHINKLMMHQVQLQRSFEREAVVYLSNRLAHSPPEHVAKLHDVAMLRNQDKHSEPLLVSEWASAKHDTLYEWMRAHPEVGTTDKDLRDRLSFAIQMYTGLDELHSAGFAHQDLKESNALLFNDPTSGNHPRLAWTDFGFAVQCKYEPVQTVLGIIMKKQCLEDSRGGTPGYRAPEQFENSMLPDRKPRREMWPCCDLWATAVVMARLFGGKATRKAISDFSAIQKAIKKGDKQVNIALRVEFVDFNVNN